MIRSTTNEGSSVTLNRSTTSRSAPLTAVIRLPEKISCTIFELGRAEAVVGMCFINFTTGEIILSDVLDSQTYVRTIHKLQIYEPSEIVVPQNLLEAGTKLTTIVRANVSQEVKILGMEKRKFNREDGISFIDRYSFPKDIIYMKNVLHDRSNALCALSGAIHHAARSYSSSTQIILNKYRMKFESTESSMFIDSNAVKSLQLVHNSADKKGISLFKYMNNTITKMGERTLRNNILQPLSDKESIEERLQAVKELKEDQTMLEFIRSELRDVQDLDKLFAVLLVNKSQHLNQLSKNEELKINHVISIKQTIKKTLCIGQQLEECNSPLLKEIVEIFTNPAVEQVRELIDDYINEDCTWAMNAQDLRNQRCYAVKSGKNGLLDVSREMYKVVIDEILEIIKRLSEERNIEAEQCYNVRRGFYIRVSNYKMIEELPEELINRIEKKKYLECTTLNVMKCNARLEDTVNEILTISSQLVEVLIEQISEFLPILFMIAEAFSLLDLVQCFSYNAIENKYYTCPEFSTEILNMKSTRHPVLDQMITPFISNDICSISELSRFQIITGTNMSGKSVYLRQVALLAIMAQIGSFIPASSGICKIYDSLWANICVDIYMIGKSTSTFETEMKEMVCVLEGSTESSLVIIDELGRGSSTHDGYAISLAICEQLVEKRATCFITTHFHKLSRLLSEKSGVIEHHMGTTFDNDNGKLKMTFNLQNGISNSKSYGIKIAAQLYSTDLIERSQEISTALSNISYDRNKYIDPEQEQREKKYQKLVEVLEYVSKNSELSQEILIEIQNEAFQ
ncbi:hypothetical protein WICMUC_002317 [Wickerhamomyces mucosus]|uniref:DNA mismatch repair proteins mutS family domain-containing protein n=1 Tax=Wickerhamomyces mucosus TaxID=1378264 RepID=A0A9P8TEL3_9ASCO|nr:hypothetical protein WICMUC_002317 [Wickerhamomyces mucosus]